jgi:ATP-dependent RNA helicase DDX24/MAK5
VDLAREIDATQHRLSKEAYEDGWLKQAAEAAEIGLDEGDGYVSLLLF